jgi:hypothetical protein
MSRWLLQKPIIMLHQISFLQPLPPTAPHPIPMLWNTQHKTLGMDNQILKINPDKHDDVEEEKEREREKVVKLVCVSLPFFSTLKTHWKIHKKGSGRRERLLLFISKWERWGKKANTKFFFARQEKKERTENFVIHQKANDYHHLSFWYHRRGISSSFEGDKKGFFLFHVVFEDTRESKREELTNNRNIENFSTLTTWNIK